MSARRSGRIVGQPLRLPSRDAAGGAPALQHAFAGCQTCTERVLNQMSVIGIGVDVIECSRIQRSIERFGDRFLHRVFTEGEIEYSMSMKFPERHLAARFAGKEAAAKAFGTGIGKAMGWRNIDIRKKESGEPFLVFSGPAETFAAERGVTSALITLSHTENYAVACVVLEG